MFTHTYKNTMIIWTEISLWY